MASGSGSGSRPYINASAVAAVIGEHPYQDPDAAFLQVLTYAPQWKGVVEAAKAGAGKRTEAEVFGAAQAEAPALTDAIAAGVAAAVEARTDTAVAAAIDAAVLLGAAAYAAAAPAATAEAKAIVQAGIVQAVQTTRGQAMEAKALDAYEADKGTVVTERNAKMTYLRTPDYVIGGRIDGFDAAKNQVIEVKNRKRKWAAPPSYDLIQLRVYLAMLAAQRDAKPGLTGVLLERFPDGTTRETPLTHDEDEWDAVHAALLGVSERFRALTPDAVHALVSAVCV